MKVKRGAILTGQCVQFSSDILQIDSKIAVQKIDKIHAETKQQTSTSSRQK